MRSVLVTLFISLAGLVLISAEQRPVVHNRLVRRCNNETHPWFYGNDTNGPPPWATEHSGSWMVPGATPTTFSISPEQSTLVTTSSSSNETAISAISGTPTSSTNSLSGNVTSTASNIAPTSTDSLASNITIASAESTAITNGMITSGASNTSSMTTTTLLSTTTIWSFPPFNFSCSISGSSCGPHNSTIPAWATGRPTDGPLSTNISSPAWGYTSPVKTDTSPEGDGTVITITIEATPAPITPSPITLPPEEITLTATVPEWRNHTSSMTFGQGTTPLSGTGSETGSTWTAESSAITMTIVIGGSMTSIISTSQPLAPTPSSSNSSIVSAISNSLSTSNSESQGASITASESLTSSLTTSLAGNQTRTSTSPVPSVSSFTINATASSTAMSPSNSNTTGLFNATATTTTAVSGNSGLPPASITTSPYWTNATNSTPCAWTPSYIWENWNYTAPSASIWNGNFNTANSTSTSTESLGSVFQTTAVSSSNSTIETSPTSSTETSPTVDSSTITSLGSPSGMMPTAISLSPDQQTNGTATPTTGDWFAISTLGDGSVLTTFVTHFGPVALSASEPGYDNAATSPSSSSVGHRVVIPPKRMAPWAKMEEET